MHHPAMEDVRTYIAEGCYTILRDHLSHPASQVGIQAFKEDALLSVGLAGHPLAEAAWSIAWSHFDARRRGTLDRVYRTLIKVARMIPGRNVR